MSKHNRISTLALATAGLAAMAIAPTGRAGRGMPGPFAGMHLDPATVPGATNPGAPSGEAKTHEEAVALFLKGRDDFHSETKKLGEATQETKNNLEALQQRLDEFETKMTKRPPIAGGSEVAEQTPEVKAFCQYARKGEKGMGAEEQKALVTDSDPDGGYLMPNNMANKIIQRLEEVSPVRELADVVSISLGDTMEFPAEDDTDFGGGWVSERGQRPETPAAKLRMIKVTAEELYANPFVSQKLLDDTAFNVEQWLIKRITRRLAKIEGAAFIKGDGIGKPRGILVAPGVAEVLTKDANLITADSLVDIFHDLPEEYAAMATWLLKRKTLGAIRLLKDGNGVYVWQPGLQADKPGTLLGRPYREAIDMPDVAAGTYPVAFGDFAEGYQVLDRQGIRVLRDPFSSKPFIEFYTTKRTGGDVVNAAAIRKLKVGA
jgi:HK97 family phage major capsid protein